MKLKRRISMSIIITAVVSVAICVIISFAFIASALTNIFYDLTKDKSKASLRTDANYIATGYSISGLFYLKSIKNWNEQTIYLLSPEGEVLFTNRLNSGEKLYLKENLAAQEYIYFTEYIKEVNFLSFPEVQQAIEQGTGEAEHYDFLPETGLFYAVLLPDGNILQLSRSKPTIPNTTQWLNSGIQFVALFLVIGFVILIILLARLLSKKCIKPISELNLDVPLENNTYEELVPILLKINSLQNEQKSQRKELNARQREFNAITENLKEGLVVLNDSGVVLSLNNSAMEILNLSHQEYSMQNIVVLSRNIQLISAVEKALLGQRNDAVLTMYGQKYYLVATPVKKKDSTTGAVLLLMELTGKQEAEKSRREFSANVSHELKTPLTSISGYAEIIENGIAKPEDVPCFAARIHKEAKGMIALIDDIIKISRLDEAENLPEKQRVDLYAIAQNVVIRLQDTAKAEQVILKITGYCCEVFGVENILQEIVYNLCENAIKYNKPNGKVGVSVSENSQNIILSVTDNGMGIPQDQQDRVFERFYRVDQSHSKQTGGTGLGLSIVKHGIQFHNGNFTLKSTIGLGTTITVYFPKNNLGV